MRVAKVSYCEFWRNSPNYWNEKFATYVLNLGFDGVIDSSKTTFDSWRHFMRAVKSPNVKFVEIRRPYCKVMSSVWHGKNNTTEKETLFSKTAGVLRATINLFWTRIIFYTIIKKNNGLLIKQEKLLNDPQKVITQVSEFLNMPIIENTFSGHQVAGNRIFHNR